MTELRELNNRTLKVKQLHFIAFHLLNFSFFTWNLFLIFFLFFSFSYILLHFSLSSSFFISTESFRFLYLGALFEASKCKRIRSCCHEQFHANQFIKLGNKTNFKIRLRTISNIISTWKLLKVHQAREKVDLYYARSAHVNHAAANKQMSINGLHSWMNNIFD